MMKSYEIDFKELFNKEYEFKYFAPGRINLVGSHVDYNGGHVLPISINLGVYALVGLRDDDKFSIFFDNDFEAGVITVSQDELQAEKSHSFANYVKAVIKNFTNRYTKLEHGLNLYFYTTLPDHGGVGMTASIEVLTAYLLNDIYKKNLTLLEQAVMAHKASTVNLQLNCGVMDPAAIALGREKNALYLNTFLMDYDYIPYNLGDYSIVVCQTNKKAKNVESKLNLRIRECQRSFDVIKNNFNVANLCSIPDKYLKMIEIILPEKKLFKRVKHVHNEEKRVIKAAEALRNGDIDTLARQINESHESLRDLFEVVGPELSTIVDLARGCQGCIAAGMVGAGFGGCAIALVYNDFLQEFKSSMTKKYYEATGINGAFFVIDACGGPKRLPRDTERIDDAVESLVQYAISKHLIEEEDYDYAINRVLGMLRVERIEKPEAHPEPLYMILDSITTYAAKKGLIENTSFAKEQFDTKLMSNFLKRPSDITKEFNSLYLESPEKALEYFYNMSLNSNYIRENKVAKNMYFKANTTYGDLEMSINLSRIEKDSKYLNFNKPNENEHYPECLLCKESVGYAGRKDYPARQNHRVIPMELNKEMWVFQYSPYPYFKEHSLLINMVHTPLVINRRTFEVMSSFVDKFDMYFIGTNADLELVGGNIRHHEHFHTGRHEFAIERANTLESFEIEGAKVSILDWPVSVLKIETTDKDSLVNASSAVLETWNTYDDLDANIISNDGTRHNAITPILRKKDGVYQMYIALRNNRCSEKYPLGIFHPHQEYLHIKKESIGIFEIMGYAILPKRLKEEISLLQDALLNNNKELDSSLEKHKDWAESLIRKYRFTKDNIRQIFNEEIANIYVGMLNDCAVFKKTEEGMCQFKKFILSIK